MESLGLVVREGNTGDRRTYSLQITPRGREVLKEIAKIGQQHNESLSAALTPDEREVLATLLQRIADQQGLTRGVHPGFSLGSKTPPSGK
jgi:DNA-binding MarR family transcriptional regulator